MMKKYTLKNGIPVVIDRMEGTKVLTSYVLFNVGSRNETKSINGVSHFLEHLFFKGTEKRPTTLVLSRELDGVGADFNAFTGKDYTGYYVKVDSRHSMLALDILEDLLFHPLFDPEEVNRERGVIIEEINMYEDNPMATAEEVAEEMLYGKEHPLGYRIAGPIKNIQTISRNQILKYRETYYHPDNMVIILSGNVPKNAVQVLEKLFGSAPRRKTQSPAPKKFTVKQKAPRLHIEKKKTAQAHMALTFPGPSYTDKDALAATLLSTILGGSMSSRLFINVRERQGLCYYIGSGVSPYQDVGAFTIQAGFDKTRINDAIAAIVQEIVDVRDNGVTEQELAQAKEYIRGKLAIRLEDSEYVAGFWGKQFFHKKSLLSADEYLDALSKVTSAQVVRFAKKTFQQSLANLVIVGEYSEKQRNAFERLIKQI